MQLSCIHKDFVLERLDNFTASRSPTAMGNHKLHGGNTILSLRSLEGQTKNYQIFWYTARPI